MDLTTKGHTFPDDALKGLRFTLVRHEKAETPAVIEGREGNINTLSAEATGSDWEHVFRECLADAELVRRQ